MKKSYAIFIVFVLFYGCNNPEKAAKDQIDFTTSGEGWALLPFVKIDSVNPILLLQKKSVFFCPVRKEKTHWEEQDVYNPATVVRNGSIYMIYRAEDTTKSVSGTSRLGLAESKDGIHFIRLPEPVFYPDEDAMKRYEWMGGSEDPRIVEDSTGIYFMTYTAYDGKIARLCVASSIDLKKWVKHGLAFKEYTNLNLWSKSGSIVCKMTEGRLIAVKIHGKYWMYWGENGFLATSEDLKEWKYVENEKGRPKSVIPSRYGEEFDNALVEPGPPAILTEKGILLIYNGASKRKAPHQGIEMYCGGQVLMDKNDPAKIISRLEKPFISPEKEYELKGQINKVTFIEGLVYFKNKWLLYYGTADSKIAVAICDKSDYK